MEDEIKTSNIPNDFDIAIIGMSCRFPGAHNVDAFWQNLINGVESIKHLTNEEILKSGVPASYLNNPYYVKAAPILEQPGMFDAEFFDYSPMEAKEMDPQHRILLECAYDALEDAGYVSDCFNGRIGVYTGSAMNTYFMYNGLQSKFIDEYIPTLIKNDKDFLSTRISYKLNLKGPSITVQTACSTSLVALHLACQSILSEESDMALAGAISVRVPHKAGYVCDGGGIVSPDGHVRAFDAKANGTVFGSGGGIVVLKRLSDAIANGDNIHAVIKGTAVNNDGTEKAGYTAPSVNSQADVVIEALSVAGVEAESISYLEAHGSGTPVGDPIEIAALTKAFRIFTERSGYCAVGSVKTNIGHLDAAAGIAGIIKTVLAFKYKKIPPTLHYSHANPEIDFNKTPFYVNSQLIDWEGQSIRRAGVMATGMGGTNAHIILEEAPAMEPSSPSRPSQLLLSAKTETALDTMSQNLAAHLKQHPNINLADASYTLQTGRRDFYHRLALVCDDIEDAVSALESGGSGRLLSAESATANREAVFMFSGQGAQYVNMGLELYQTEAAFRDAIDRCSEILIPYLKQDLRDILYPQNAANIDTSQQKLTETAITQPALFTVEYALAKLWASWGIQPDLMVGHSIGEYVAACLADVFTLDDAVALVAARGRLIQGLPLGAMLAVPLSEQDIQAYTDSTLSLAAVNAPSVCVLSGKTEAIENVEKKLSQQDIGYQRLHTSHAFHSKMMDPILKEFEYCIRQIELKPPQVPYLTNVTGTWITADEATDPAYWSRHLRRTVRFADCVSELIKAPNRILLEVGPGITLCTLARMSAENSPDLPIFSSMRHPKKQTSDLSFILTTMGRIWLAGVQPDWDSFYANESRHRISLPTYPFERQRFWLTASAPIETGASLPTAYATPEELLLEHKKELADWFYVPSWRQTPIADPRSVETTTRSSWLVFIDELGLGARLAKLLEQNGQDVFKVKIGEIFSKTKDRSYTLNPQNGSEYEALFNDLKNRDKMPQTIVHLWNLTDAASKNSGLRWLDKHQDLGLYSLLNMVQAIGKHGMHDKFRLEVISNNVHDVTGQEILQPEKATILSACKVIPLEYANIVCRHLDVLISKMDSCNPNLLNDQLLAEFAKKTSEVTVAFRGRHRWVPSFEPVRMDEAVDKKPTRLKDGGVYLITGGLGGIGFALAEDIAKAVRAKLILTGRSEFPPRDTWEQWLATHPADDRTSMKIKDLLSIEKLGSEVLVASADIADLNQMQQVMDRATRRFGPINGVIHAAGVIDEAGVIQRRTQEMTEKGLSSKVRGTLVIDEILKDVPLDFMLLCSSVASVFYHNRFGEVSYVAGNSFLDAFSAHKTAESDTFTVTINWDEWQGIGMSVKAQKLFIEAFGRHGDLVDPLDQLTPAEGVILFRRILKSNFSRIVISTRDLGIRLANDALVSSPFLEAALNADLSKQQHPRPNLSTEYVAPGNQSEITIAGIWEELLGFGNVGIHDDYFELGGDSLIAARFISRLRETFQVEMPLQMLFETPSIQGMADKIETLLWANQGTKDTFEQAGIDLVEGEI